MKNAIQFFVTGTGTEVGKTTVAAALLLGAQRAQKILSYWKPVQTGGKDVDLTIVKNLSQSSVPTPLSSWNYALPASPDQAAAEEGREGPTVSELLSQWNTANDLDVLIEGAGGLLVPLNEQNETWVDFLRATAVPVVLVASSQLGTLNHTGLSLAALEAAGIPVLAVILSGPRHPANERSLRRMYPETKFLTFPEVVLEPGHSSLISASDLLWQEFRDLLFTPQPASDWMEFDKKFVWHPYTQHQTSPDPVPIVAARGIYLKSADGETLVDASASWWTSSLGHGRTEIGRAIHKQQATLDHCIFAGATHQAGSTLAARLIEKTQGRLQRVFYSDNGSCAVEVALKMAAQYWRNRNQPERRLFLYFKGAYHGDTFGAMSVASTEGFHKAFQNYMFQGVVATPVTSHPSHLCPEGKAALPSGLNDLHRIFEQYGPQMAGVIIEPLLQGASGMNVQELVWLQELQKLCKLYQAPFILDEVFTGLGRIGDTFAFLRAQLDPDIVCIAKGLTGGTLPLAATLCKQYIFDGFLDTDRSKALLHGHTFTGNPISCAAALTTLDIYDQERLIERIQGHEVDMKEWLSTKGTELALENVRAIGGVMAWELPGSGMGNYFHPLALEVPKIARRHGLLMRTLGNTLYFAPPLAISQKELAQCLNRIEGCLRELLTVHQ